MSHVAAFRGRGAQILVAILLLTAVVPVPTFGQTINSFSVGQVSWQDPTGAPLPGGTNSGWETLTMNVTPAPSAVYYVNMSARLTGSGNPHVWMVRNLPILPATAQTDANQQVTLNLPDLTGFTIGSLPGNLDIIISLDTSPQPSQPGGSAFNLFNPDSSGVASSG
jgi:hypothetical protein